MPSITVKDPHEISRLLAYRSEAWRLALIDAEKALDRDGDFRAFATTLREIARNVSTLAEDAQQVTFVD